MALLVLMLLLYRDGYASMMQMLFGYLTDTKGLSVLQALSALSDLTERVQHTLQLLAVRACFAAMAQFDSR